MSSQLQWMLTTTGQKVSSLIRASQSHYFIAGGFSQMDERRRSPRDHAPRDGAYRTRDLAVNVLVNIVGALFFFHPMVRYASKRLGLEREIACDDRVVNAGMDPANYAENLYKVASRCILSSRTHEDVHGLTILSAREILERRIEMILNEDRVRFVAKQWRYLVFSALLIGGVVWLLIPARTVTEITRVNGVDRESQHRYTVTITREAPDKAIKISSIKIKPA